MKPSSRTRYLPVNSSPQVFIRKFLLLKAGISINSLATRLNVSPQFCSQLIAGKKRSQEKENTICRILRTKRSVIW